VKLVAWCCSGFGSCVNRFANRSQLQVSSVLRSPLYRIALSAFSRDLPGPLSIVGPRGLECVELWSDSGEATMASWHGALHDVQLSRSQSITSRFNHKSASLSVCSAIRSPVKELQRMLREQCGSRVPIKFQTGSKFEQSRRCCSEVRYSSSSA
jgi:hypothetical protein